MRLGQTAGMPAPEKWDPKPTTLPGATARFGLADAQDAGDLATTGHAAEIPPPRHLRGDDAPTIKESPPR